MLQDLQLEGWGQAQVGPPKGSLKGSQSLTLAQQAQEDLLLGLGPLASFVTGVGNPGVIPGSSNPPQPITGVLAFPQLEQSGALRSTQLDIPSLAWSMATFDSSAARQSEQPAAQHPQSTQARASGR